MLEVSTKPDFPTNFTRYRVSTRSSELILEALATTIPWYWRVRTADRAGNLSDWSATNTFTTGLSGSLPSVSMVQVYPTSIVGGQSPLGVVHLTKPAPSGGAVVTLSVKDGRGFTQTVVPLAAVPETITVPAGAISANLPINTSAVSNDTPVGIYATIAGIGAKGTVNVGPAAALKAASLAEPGDGHRREPGRRHGHLDRPGARGRTRRSARESIPRVRLGAGEHHDSRRLHREAFRLPPRRCRSRSTRQSKPSAQPRRR